MTAARRLKVCRIITRLIVGGAQETAVNLSRLLDPQRFETMLVSGPPRGPEGSLVEEARGSGVRVIIVPSLVRRLDPALYWRAYRELRRIIREEKPDIVHTHSTEAGILGRWAAHREGVPVIIHTVHGWGFHDHMNPALRSLNIAVERRTARFTGGLVVVSERDREKGLAAGIGRPEQYRLIRSAIDLQPFRGVGEDSKTARRRLDIPDGRKVVGSVGRLSPQKDPLAFVRIARKVVDRRSDTHFVFLGDGPMRNEVEGLVVDLQLRDHLSLPGLRRDIPQLLRSFDVFTLTSRWEGLPRAVVESMAAGVPVVAFAVDGLAEVLGGACGVQVPPGNEVAHSEALIELLDDPARARMLAERAAARVAEFDLPHMVENTHRLYEELAVGVGMRT